MNAYSVDKTFIVTEPDIHPSVYIAPGTHIIARVTMKEKSSAWFNVVIRGDVNQIEIGKGSNIQDGSIIHVTNHDPCVVGDHVVVGHHVNLHGCTLEDEVLVGIGAIVLSGAKIGRGSILAAGAVIKEKAVVEPYSLMAGVPAKKIKTLPESTAESNKKMAEKYIELSHLYKKSSIPSIKH